MSVATESNAATGSRIPARAVRLPRTVAFWVIGSVFVALMASSAAPSPLYPVYQEKWGFSSSTLTLVFAVYALALLAALLTVGSLSDHLGRKPVVLTALVVMIASLVVFVFADGVAWLIAARVVQGLAAGAATGALTATVVDLQPNPRIGPLVTSVAPALGLGAGALGAGALVQFLPMPTQLVYLVLIAVIAVLVVAVALVPEPVDAAGFSSRRHAVRVLTPSVGVPSSMRADFLLVAPCLVATWALGGFHLSLGPSIIGGVFGLRGAVVSGLDIFALFVAGALAVTIVRAVSPRRVMVGGAIVLAVGLVIDLVALGAGLPVLYFVGSAISGFGWGSAFFGVMRIITAITPPERRGGVFATTFVVSYLAFSVPAVLGGIAVHSAGLQTTAEVYGIVVVVLALASAAGITLRSRDGAPAPAR